MSYSSFSSVHLVVGDMNFPDVTEGNVHSSWPKNGGFTNLDLLCICIDGASDDKLGVER